MIGPPQSPAHTRCSDIRTLACAYSDKSRSRPQNGSRILPNAEWRGYGDCAPALKFSSMRVQCEQLTKDFGKYRAVNALSFTLDAGEVTGFLGPNGSGKSTTMRLMLGLDSGGGRTLYDGKPLWAYDHPARVVGAHLDAKFFHPNRTARDHLRMLAAASGVSRARVDEVIEVVGLQTVATKRPRGFSLGMGQRLGLAGALLSKPDVLMLDEPANGLDPQSIAWLRDFVKNYAATGKVVFVSSHLLSEMELLAAHLVVIGKGTLIADEPLSRFVERSTRNDIFVRTPNPQGLIQALQSSGMSAIPSGTGLAVAAGSTDQVGAVAFAHGIEIHELLARRASLEEAFLELTSSTQEYTMESTTERDA